MTNLKVPGDRAFRVWFCFCALLAVAMMCLLGWAATRLVLHFT